MTQDSHPIAELSFADLDAMLRRALRNTLILGAIAALIVWIGGGWPSAALLATGRADLGRQHLGVAAAGARHQRPTG